MRTIAARGLQASVVAIGCGLSLAACGQQSLSTPSSTPKVAKAAEVASTGALRSIVLRPSQLGSGFRERLLPYGNRVRGQVTLDLCGQTFASESLRRQRLQFVYAAPSSKTEVSNEVVRYAPGGAAQAYAELKRVLASCPARPQSGPVKGAKDITYRIRAVHFPGTLPHSIGLEDRQSKGTLNVTQFVIYQFDGDYLSAIYGHSTKLGAQRAIVAKAASASAADLKHAVR